MSATLDVAKPAGLLVNKQHLPFSLDQGIARRAAIGLIVLATDHTIEHEWRAMLGALDGVAFYESRIWNSSQITPETLREMEKDIAQATRLIRPGERIDVAAFACTSGAMVIGDEHVAAGSHQAGARSLARGDRRSNSALIDLDGHYVPGHGIGNVERLGVGRENGIGWRHSEQPEIVYFVCLRVDDEKPMRASGRNVKLAPIRLEQQRIRLGVERKIREQHGSFQVDD